MPSDASELTITRIFDAPRALVFEAWTDPDHLARWSGPEGFTSSQDYFSATPGGKYRVCLREPDGTEHWVRGTYREVVPPEKLVFTHAWEDGHGGTSPETLVTVLFTELDGKTKMVLRQTGFDSKASRDGHEGGWSSSFADLDRYLARSRQPARARSAVR